MIKYLKSPPFWFFLVAFLTFPEVFVVLGLTIALAFGLFLLIGPQ
jgi:hypothetical protein